ncbi:hypothetical protein RHMOL_Rhmol08G0136800 [Rhododendron molle]|uniref:Uncharacterized protein n=1 Tax=Rhododendron molle TaxID=49168 RepID=A0ACC0MPC7_RHOML|nr:hypothetical protein RHMOL_Rhmol08G0136800 [Rhododendron molle]
MAKDTAPSPEDSSDKSPPPPPPSDEDDSSAKSPPPAASSPPPKSSPSPPPPSKSSPPPEESSSPPPPPPPAEDSSTSPPPPPPPPDKALASPPPPPSTTNSPSPTSSTVASPPPPHSSSSSSPPPPPVASKKSPSSSTSSGSPPPPPPPTSSSSSSSSSSDNTGVIIGAVIAGIVIFAVIVICLTCCSKKKKRKQYYMDPTRGPQGDYYNGSVKWNNPLLTDPAKLPPPPGGVGGWGAPPPPPQANISGEYSSGFSGPYHTPVPSQTPNMGLGNNQFCFTYEELASATNGFSQANILGQGGFGYVHKGVLPNGKEVAVKSLKSGSGQGEREFQAEVEIISRVHHRHLVSLVGYCIADGQRMLVYEFVSNKTLEFHLHGHPKIIHRDIKAANILLDNNFEAMVADFGLAKLSSDNYTHVSTRVMGTFGYLAPEYASSGKLSDKSDVFSFGVMLLELITGRRPVDPTNKYMEDSLVDWARPLLGQALQDGNYEELVDPRLEDNFAPHEMARMVACAAASIRHSARRRAKMSQIVRALEGDASLDDLVNEGVKPNQSSSNSSSDTRAYDTGAYNADMLKFKQMVLSSRDLESSEYGATSEYGLNPSVSSSDSTELGQPGTQRHKL